MPAGNDALKDRLSRYRGIKIERVVDRLELLAQPLDVAGPSTACPKRRTT